MSTTDKFGRFAVSPASTCALYGIYAHYEGNSTYLFDLPTFELATLVAKKLAAIDKIAREDGLRDGDAKGFGKGYALGLQHGKGEWRKLATDAGWINDRKQVFTVQAASVEETAAFEKAYSAMPPIFGASDQWKAEVLNRLTALHKEALKGKSLPIFDAASGVAALVHEERRLGILEGRQQERLEVSQKPNAWKIEVLKAIEPYAFVTENTTAERAVAWIKHHYVKEGGRQIPAVKEKLNTYQVEVSAEFGRMGLSRTGEAMADLATIKAYARATAPDNWKERIRELCTRNETAFSEDDFHTTIRDLLEAIRKKAYKFGQNNAGKQTETTTYNFPGRRFGKLYWTESLTAAVDAIRELANTQPNVTSFTTLPTEELNALRARANMQECIQKVWHGMETAPKDGGTLLFMFNALFKKRGYAFGKFSKNGLCWMDLDGKVFEPQPFKWRDPETL